MRLQKLIKCIGFFLGLFVILTCMSGVFKRQGGLYVYDAGAVDTKAAELDAEPDNTIDILFAGDSICYSSFSPTYMWENFGYTSYVCGTSAQRLCDTYAILSQAFETQSPKMVVLETNCLYRELSDDVTNDWILDELTRRFEVFANHSDWKSVISRLGIGKSKMQSQLKGFISRKSVNPYIGGDYMKPTDAVENIEPDILGYLNDIDSLCRKNGAILVLVSSPSPKNWSYERHNAVMNWASEKGVNYIDLNLAKDINIDWATDTKDAGDHLNLERAKKVTKYIGRILGGLCELKDTRNNPDFKDWERCSTYLY